MPTSDFELAILTELPDDEEEGDLGPPVLATQVPPFLVRTEAKDIGNIAVADSLASAKDALQRLKYYRDSARCCFACDTEVAFIDAKKQSPCLHGTLICFSIYCGPQANFAPDGTGRVAPMLWVDLIGSTCDPQRFNRTSCLPPEGAAILQLFKTNFFEDPSYPKIWHNYSFDYHALNRAGVSPRGFCADTLVMSWILADPYRREHSLDKLSHDQQVMEPVFGRPGYDPRLCCKTPMSELFGLQATAELDVLRLQLDLQTRATWIYYSATDTQVTWWLFEALRVHLRHWPCGAPARSASNTGAAPPSSTIDLWDVYQLALRPAGDALVGMESIGVPIAGGLAAVEAAIGVLNTVRSGAEQRFRQLAAELGAPRAELARLQSDVHVRAVLLVEAPQGPAGAPSEDVPAAVAGSMAAPGPIPYDWPPPAGVRTEGGRASVKIDVLRELAGDPGAAEAALAAAAAAGGGPEARARQAAGTRLGSLAACMRQPGAALKACAAAGAVWEYRRATALSRLLRTLVDPDTGNEAKGRLHVQQRPVMRGGEAVVVVRPGIGALAEEGRLGLVRQLVALPAGPSAARRQLITVRFPGLESRVADFLRGRAAGDSWRATASGPRAMAPRPETRAAAPQQQQQRPFPPPESASTRGPTGNGQYSRRTNGPSPQQQQQQRPPHPQVATAGCMAANGQCTRTTTTANGHSPASAGPPSGQGRSTGCYSSFDVTPQPPPGPHACHAGQGTEVGQRQGQGQASAPAAKPQSAAMGWLDAVQLATPVPVFGPAPRAAAGQMTPLGGNAWSSAKPGVPHPGDGADSRSRPAAANSDQRSARNSDTGSGEGYGSGADRNGAAAHPSRHAGGAQQEWQAAGGRHARLPTDEELNAAVECLHLHEQDHDRGRDHDPAAAQAGPEQTPGSWRALGSGQAFKPAYNWQEYNALHQSQRQAGLRHTALGGPTPAPGPGHNYYPAGPGQGYSAGRQRPAGQERGGYRIGPSAGAGPQATTEAPTPSGRRTGAADHASGGVTLRAGFSSGGVVLGSSLLGRPVRVARSRSAAGTAASGAGPGGAAPAAVVAAWMEDVLLCALLRAVGAAELSSAGWRPALLAKQELLLEGPESSSVAASKFLSSALARPWFGLGELEALVWDSAALSQLELAVDVHVGPTWAHVAQ